MAYLTEKFGPAGFHLFAGAGETAAAAGVPAVKAHGAKARRRSAGHGTFLYGLPLLSLFFLL
jgi:NitT/TauT family transport system permease protein